MTRRALAFLGALFLIAVVAGGAWLWRARVHPAEQPERPAEARPSPQTPVTDAATTVRGDVSIDLRRQQLVGVRTAKATRTSLGSVIHATGVVRNDETRVTDVNVKLDGWVRELFVDYTGQTVTKGQPLFTLYSPELVAAEHEYVLALKARDQLRASVLVDAQQRADALVSAARRRLTLWDVTADDLRVLDEARAPADTVVVRSPATGVVMDKQILAGAHVAPGQTLYKLADLSVVWVEANVYEQDIPSIRLGDRATVSVESMPRALGRVVYIEPYVDEQTRTTKVRYEFANPRGRLKPGMYASVEMTTTAGFGVTVPTDAVLDSGREQVVFVAEGDGRFAPRHVTIGRRLDRDVQIVDGLKEGEEVASGAAFFLDSESQLRSALQGFASAPSVSPTSATDRISITLHTTPDPAKTGENQFEVAVADARGGPIGDAQVTVHLFMPAMPTMNMPAMRNEVPLASAGNGMYRGTGQVMMAGRWDATVNATRGGQQLGTFQTTISAK